MDFRHGGALRTRGGIGSLATLLLLHGILLSRLATLNKPPAWDEQIIESFAGEFGGYFACRMQCIGRLWKWGIGGIIKLGAVVQTLALKLQELTATVLAPTPPYLLSPEKLRF